MSLSWVQKLKNKIWQFATLKRALMFVWESSPKWTVVNTVLLILQGIQPLLTLYVLKLILDAVAYGLENPDPISTFSEVSGYIVLAAAISVAGYILRSLSDTVSDIQSYIVTDHMSNILHNKSIEVDLQYYENSEYYNTMHRAQREAYDRPTDILYGLIGLGQNAVSLIAVGGLVLVFHWSLGIILLAAAIPGVFLRVRYAQRFYEWRLKQTKVEREASYLDWMLVDGSHAKELRIFDLGQVFIDRFQKFRAELRQQRVGLLLWYSARDLTTQIFATIAVFVAYGFIAYRTLQGDITIGDLVMYYHAFQRGQGFLNGVLGNLTSLYHDNLFLSYLYEFLDIEPKVKDSENPVPLVLPMKQGFKLENVSFQYPTDSRQSLTGIDMEIRPGEIVALVGRNGSGKTTLTKLLCRLYDPTEGRITIDGVDYRDLSVSELRREISIIFQDYTHYHFTASENIHLGNIKVPKDAEAIQQAAKNAGIHKTISSLHNGYDTILGKYFEGGEEISIGEWQKIALARAYLRSGQLIIMDEPTSAMDAYAEYEFFENFRQLVEGRSTILISHRLSTLKMADTIYVLEDGQVVAKGSHVELMAQDGLYTNMFQTQAQTYVEKAL